MAAPVLVLWPPGSLHCHHPRLRDRRAYSPSVYTQAVAGRGARIGWLLDRGCLPELYGVGPPHVRQRDEPVFGAAIFGADADHHDPVYRLQR